MFQYIFKNKKYYLTAAYLNNIIIIIIIIIIHNNQFVLNENEKHTLLKISLNSNYSFYLFKISKVLRSDGNDR